MGEIVLKDVCKRYPNGFEAVVNLNLTIGDGEFLVIVGPSGCGKTTALRMVAGLEDITSGTISIGGRVVNGVKPKDRDIAMVFQDYALYPQMTVYQNMAFGLKMRRMPKQEIDRIIRDVAATLGLEAMLDRKPGQLSGGQRQRVAMGRAIARRPTAFLMDEPLSNLDAKLRVQMRAEIARIQHELNVTTLYVTHDQVEAVTLGDRVAVLRDGVLQQVDRPKVLYDRPISTFVASFIGSPTINLMYGRLSRGEAGMELELGDDRLRLPDSAVAEFHALERYEGAEVVVGVRAEDLHDVVAESDWPHDQRLTGEVALVEDLGAELLVHMDVNSRNAADADVDPDAREGQIREDVTRVVARMGKDSRPRQGGRFEVGVDCSRLHLFDPVSFRSLRGSEVGVDAIGA